MTRFEIELERPVDDEDWAGVEYDTQDAIKVAEEKKWLKGRAPKCKG